MIYLRFRWGKQQADNTCPPTPLAAHACLAINTENPPAPRGARTFMQITLLSTGLETTSVTKHSENKCRRRCCCRRGSVLQDERVIFTLHSKVGLLHWWCWWFPLVVVSRTITTSSPALCCQTTGVFALEISLTCSQNCIYFILFFSSPYGQFSSKVRNKSLSSWACKFHYKCEYLSTRVRVAISTTSERRHFGLARRC